MSGYDDYDRPRRSRRGEYDDYESTPRRSRRPRNEPSNMPPYPPNGSDSNIPPPPMGPALKRDGSRSRLPRDARPEFPDEAAYMGAGAPDLERKDRPSQRKFREKRDGYESDEGEAHKKSSRRDRRERRGGGDYDDDYDEPSSRRGRNHPEGVEYGAAPIRRSKADRDGGRPSRRDRYDDYSSDEESPPPRRRDRRSKRDDAYDDRGYRSDEIDRRDREARRRRNEIYDRDREDRRRGEVDKRQRRRPSSYDDKYDDYGDRDRDGRRRRGGGDRNRDRDRPPTEMKIGKYDVGPWIDKGQKHWGTVGPIVTPLVMNLAKNYMGGAGGKR